ncbi:protein CD300H-like [Hemicordylus capensis]|uniref:protein CD300H-like n=1 Tax=Hemicordylus capensis TaxID=884348 RepID=UPI002304887F|nr:protein CD300H-like [Hemicordylus capensis]
MPLLSLVGMVLLLPACFSELTGPGTVYGIVGSSVSVPCRYDQKYKQNMKYWCKEGDRRNCAPVVQTRGSELTVKLDKASITDNHSLNQFTVTMYGLANSDTGKYHCGIAVAGGSDLTVPVNVTVVHSASAIPKNVKNELNWNTVEHSELNFSYLMYVSFLVSIGLKIPIFLCMLFSMIWMHRRDRQHSKEGMSP